MNKFFCFVIALVILVHVFFYIKGDIFIPVDVQPRQNVIIKNCKCQVEWVSFDRTLFEATCNGVNKIYTAKDLK